MASAKVNKSHTKKVAAVFEKVVRVSLYTLNNEFRGEASTAERAMDALYDKNGSAYLRDNSDGTYTVYVHSNRWYELYTA